jgi:hypothetical protein
MKLGFIDDVEPRRTKLHHQLFTKTLSNGHSVLLSLIADTTYQCKDLADVRSGERTC